MATIEERKQQLEKKLKKMAEDNVVVKPVTVPNPFDPSEDTEPSLATSREEDKSSGKRNGYFYSLLLWDFYYPFYGIWQTEEVSFGKRIGKLISRN